MGLDQYAYVAAYAGQQDAYNQQEGDWDSDTQQWITNGPIGKPREIAYWRKHYNLQSWMQRQWESRGNQGDFNDDELELSWQDIDALETAVNEKKLPLISGLSYGDDADEFYQKQDLEFIKNARAELFMGLKVFYNSNW